MDWVHWVIPLIAIAVWIVSNLVKNQQEEARRKQVQPQKPLTPEDADQPREAPQRENPFLEEIRRRQRERQLRPQPVPVQEKPKPRPVIVRPEPVVRPSRLPPPLPRAIPEAIIVSDPVAPLVHFAPTTTGQQTTKAIQNLHAMLKNRLTVATAFLLTEVLGQPKCKRHK